MKILTVDDEEEHRLMPEARLKAEGDEAESAIDQLRNWNETLERRVREATSELRQANEELEAFAYSVSHDLRSALRSIEGLVFTAVSNNPSVDEAERRHFLGRAAAIALEGQEIINGLLEYSRLKSVELALAPVSLEEAVKTALDKLESAESPRAEIEIQPLPSVVRAHETTLSEVIYHLLSNAVKFVKPGTLPHVTISEESRDGWVRLNIKDNGIGVPPEFVERIFKVFEHPPDTSRYKGSGVGLAIVHRAVQKMQGRVGVDANKPRGSVFLIELPKV